MWLLSVLIVTCSTSSIWAILDDDSCNYTWYSMKDGQCKCGSDLSGRLRCNDFNKTVEITAGVCMTYDTMRRFKNSTLVVAICPMEHCLVQLIESIIVYQLILLWSTPLSALLTIVKVCFVENVLKDLVLQFTPLIFTVPTALTSSTGTAITLYITLEVCTYNCLLFHCIDLIDQNY